MSEIQVGDWVTVVHKSQEASRYELGVPIGARGIVILIGKTAPKYLVEFDEHPQYCFEDEIEAEKPAVKVWSWADAPQHLKDAAATNGDEDWLAFVPQELHDNWAWWPVWLDEPHFGNRCYQREVRDGWIVVGCHA